MISKSGLNSKAVFEERTATSSSVILSGARRENEEPDALAIADYTTESPRSDSLGAGAANYGRAAMMRATRFVGRTPAIKTALARKLSVAR